jgi:hypothetical protein
VAAVDYCFKYRNTPKAQGLRSKFLRTSELECRSELDAAIKALQLKNSQVSGTCTFRDYLTPNRTF